MPTVPGTKSNLSLSPQQTLEKIGGLITEIGADQPPTPEPAEPAEPQAATPEPPATAPAPPAPADQPETPEDDDELEEVVVDGEPVQVSRAELRRNYSQHAHNTQRAQELSAREKDLEPQIRQRVEAEVQEQRLRYIQGLEQLTQALQRMEGEPDWVKLRGEASDAD